MAWELGHRLQGLSVPHAVLDTDELDRVWPQPEPVHALMAVTQANLRAVWGTFSRLGTRHLILCGVMASIPLNKKWIEEALAPATITFVRLTADRATRQQRLRTREVGTGFERDMRASDEVAVFVARHDPSDMPTVATEGKTVLQVAEEVLVVGGWAAVEPPRPPR